MTGGIRRYWDGLSLRERALLGIAALLFGGLLLWLAWFGPLADAVDDAAARHGEAVEREAVVAARAADIRRRSAAPAAGQAQTSPAGRLDLVIAQSAAERGLTLSRNDAAGDAMTSIAVTNAGAGAVLAWIAGLEQGGIVAAEVTLTPAGNGLVNATATLRRAAP